MNWEKQFNLEHIKIKDWVWVDKKTAGYSNFHMKKYSDYGAKTDGRGVRLQVIHINDKNTLTLWYKFLKDSGDFFKYADIYKVE